MVFPGPELCFPFPTLLLLPSLPLSVGSGAHSEAKLQTGSPRSRSHEALAIPQECLIEFLYFCHRVMPCGSTVPPASCYPPKMSRSSPVCHPKPGRREQCGSGSTYLLAELVGQLAKTAPRLTPSPAWDIKHKPSSDLLMRGSPALL